MQKRNKVRCIFSQNERFLFSLHTYDDKDGYYLIPVGGEIEDKENLLDAIIREAKEEIGFDITDPLYLGMLSDKYISDTKEKVTIITFCFMVRVPDNITLPQKMRETTGKTFELKYFHISDLLETQVPVLPKGIICMLKQISS